MSTERTGDVGSGLPARLLQEAVSIVREGGHHALSLREVQRRAGVSPAAAYRHFHDRSDLLRAVAERAAGLLADRVAVSMGAVRATGDEATDARDRLRAGCEGYISFALDEPGLYRAVFFSADRIDELLSPAPESRGIAGMGAYQLLVEALRAVAVAEGAPEVNQWDPLVIWSSCHGLAMLRLEAALRPLSVDEFGEARDYVLTALINVPQTEPCRPSRSDGSSSRS